MVCTCGWVQFSADPDTDLDLVDCVVMTPTLQHDTLKRGKVCITSEAQNFRSVLNDKYKEASVLSVLIMMLLLWQHRKWECQIQVSRARVLQGVTGCILCLFKWLSDEFSVVIISDLLCLSGGTVCRCCNSFETNIRYRCVSIFWDFCQHDEWI